MICRFEGWVLFLEYTREDTAFIIRHSGIVGVYAIVCD